LFAPSSRFTRLVLATALAIALVASGCGGTSGKDRVKSYRNGLIAANTKFNTELTRAGATMRAAGQTKSREQYGQGAGQLHQAAAVFKKELAALDTPPDAENEEQAVVRAVDRFTAAVGRINSAVQADDQARIKGEVAAVQTSGAAVDQAIETLKDAVR
jgi:hypothetical protein